LQASIQSRAQGRGLAQDHGALRLGSGQKERQISKRNSSALRLAARGRRLDAHRRLSHAQGGTLYHDLGRNYFDRRSTDRQKKLLVKRLVDLGYAVELTPVAA